MNNKGIIFSLDLIFALILFVALFGLVYQAYSYTTEKYKEMKINSELEAQIDYISNSLILNKEFSCALVDDKNVFIKFLSFCVDSAKFNISKLDLPENIKVNITYLSEDNSFEPRIEKSIKLLVLPPEVNGNIKKSEYYKCAMGLDGCFVFRYEKLVSIGVDYE